MDRRKLIVVSNRGPVTFGRDSSGRRSARRGGGGLVTALRSLVSHHDVTWIASAMSEEDKAVAAEAGGKPIEERARDGAPYRLRLVRDREPPATLAHFVHIPWAQPDYWRVLPPEIRRAIHDGLLANDLIGFHTTGWLRNFLVAAEMIAGAECDHEAGFASHRGRRTLVTARPISVDPYEFEELAESEPVLAAQAEIRARRPERLVLRVDRTDPSKNVVRGFRAF